MGFWKLVGSFFTEAGPGGAFVLLIIVIAGIIYYRLTRWILQGGKKR